MYVHKYVCMCVVVTHVDENKPANSLIKTWVNLFNMRL